MSNQQAQVLAEIEGNWQQEEVMKVNGKTMFNLMKDFPFKCKPERFPLASDASYREDLIGWQLDDFDLSMKYSETTIILLFRKSFNNTRKSWKKDKEKIENLENEYLSQVVNSINLRNHINLQIANQFVQNIYFLFILFNINYSIISNKIYKYEQS